jgi:hypothetical protein
MQATKEMDGKGLRPGTGRQVAAQKVGDLKAQENSSEVNQKTKNGKTRSEELGGFTTTLRVVPISLLAMAIGALCAYVALALLRLIGLFTNLFYFGRWSTAMVSPVGNHLGVFSVLVPIGAGR